MSICRFFMKNLATNKMLFILGFTNVKKKKNELLFGIYSILQDI